MTKIVQQFVAFTRAASVACRIQAAEGLADAYLNGRLAEEERGQVEAVMTALLDDQSMEVRLALAKALAGSEIAPHHIILSLAADAAPVAAVVAERSPVILDSELVDMIGANEPSVQLAVARRPFVSRALAAALSEVGSAAACLALVANGGARLPRFSLDRIIERHGDCPELRLTLLERADLPLDVRQVLLVRLSSSLRNLAVNQGWLTPERADTVTRDARERATIAAAFEAPAETMPMLVDHLLEAGDLTPAFVIRAAASGQTLLFETALAALANLPLQRVRALIASGRGGSLQALLQKAELPPNTFPAFLAAIRVVREGDPAPGAAGDYRRAMQVIEAMVEGSGNRPDRDLDPILALLRGLAREAKRASVRDTMEQFMEAA